MTENAQSKGFDEESSPLDIFSFISVASDSFPGYTFGISGADTLEHLIGEIRRSKPGIKVAEFRKYLENNLIIVQEYKDYIAQIGNGMNPYTQIRHCLFAEDSAVFQDLIFEGHQKNFQRWREHGTVFPNEVAAK